MELAIRITCILIFLAGVVALAVGIAAALSVDTLDLTLSAEMRADAVFGILFGLSLVLLVVVIYAVDRAMRKNTVQALREIENMCREYPDPNSD